MTTINTPPWLTDLLQRRSVRGSSVEFCSRFLQAPSAEQLAVVASWQPVLGWDALDPWRVSCADESQADSVKRITTILLFEALGMERTPSRDDIVTLGILYNLAWLSGEDADLLFERISNVVGSLARRALIDFVARPVELKQLEAFKLRVVDEPNGGRLLVMDPA